MRFVLLARISLIAGFFLGLSGLMAADSPRRASASVGAWSAVQDAPAVRDRVLSLYAADPADWVSRFHSEATVAAQLDAVAAAGFNRVRLVAGDERGKFPHPAWRLWVEGPGAAGPEWQGRAAGQEKRNLAALRRLTTLARERGLTVSLGIRLRPRGVDGLDAAAGDGPEGLGRMLARQTGLAGLQFLPETSGEGQAATWEGGLLALARMAHRAVPGIVIEVPWEVATANLISRVSSEGITLRVNASRRLAWPGLPMPSIRTALVTGREGPPLPRGVALTWLVGHAGPACELPWDGPEDVRRWVALLPALQGDGLDLRAPAAWGRGDGWSVGDAVLRMWGGAGAAPSGWEEHLRHDFEGWFGAGGARWQAAWARCGGVLPLIVAAVHPPSVEGGFPASVERSTLGRVLADYASRPSGNPALVESLADAARRILAGSVTARRTPEETMGALEAAADAVFSEVEALGAEAASSPASRAMLRAVRSVGWLARFHARRMRAAVHYNLFLRGQKLPELVAATFGEKDAVGAWRELVALAEPASADGGGDSLGAAWRSELRRLEQSLRELEDMCCPPDEAVLREKVWSPAAAERFPGRVEHQRPVRAEVGSGLRLAVRLSGMGDGARVWLRHGAPGGEEFTEEMSPGTAGEHAAVISGEAFGVNRAWIYRFEIHDARGRAWSWPGVAEGGPGFVVPVVVP